MASGRSVVAFFGIALSLCATPSTVRATTESYVDGKTYVDGRRIPDICADQDADSPCEQAFRHKVELIFETSDRSQRRAQEASRPARQHFKLVPFAPHCSHAEAAGPYARLCQPSWARLEAHNGEVYHVDLRDLQFMPNGAVGAYVVIGASQIPLNIRELYFDCRGHWSDFEDPGGMSDAPPRSVAGRLAQAACSLR
jgi:hypothetical protein